MLWEETKTFITNHLFHALSLNKYCLNIFYVPGTARLWGYKAEIQASKSTHPWETRLSGRTIGAARGSRLNFGDSQRGLPKEVMFKLRAEG